MFYGKSAVLVVTSSSRQLLIASRNRKSGNPLDYRVYQVLGRTTQDTIGFMQSELRLAQQTVLFDQDATAALYRDTITVPGADSCKCISCQNFAAQRGRVFPEAFIQFLKELGVDPLKEWEAFDYDFDARNAKRSVLCGGWFLFVGQVVEGLDKRREQPDEGFAYWFTTNFPTGTLPPHLKLCAVEFLGQIPWVL